ncbi:MAG TPA: sugar phosphate isomerase/epimerase [Beutenbergiaceae bacterium]|nr:sugar phosphate isomerase/epimerase [Beutenbergiaceae bacterium]
MDPTLGATCAALNEEYRLVSYSLQLYTLREHLDADLDATLRRVAQAGYQQVEPYRIVPDPHGLASALHRHGLSAPTAHAPLLDGPLEEIFAAAAHLGAGTVIAPSSPAEAWDDPEQIKALASSLNEAARRASDLGLRVGYHNHWWEFAPVAGRSALEYFADQLYEQVVLQIDTYWAAVAGMDPVRLLERLGSRVQSVHLKDGPINADPSAQVALGEGSMPIGALLEAAAYVPVQVVELDDHRGDMFTAVERSLAFLQAGAR